MNAVIDDFLAASAPSAGAAGSRSVRLALPCPRSTAALPEVSRLLAGVAEVDVTPPPGMPKSGHSRNAQDGTGFRTRIRVRVLHLRAGRASMALIAGDLHAGSAVVQRLVAGAVAATTDIPLAGIFMGATHTHAGPGQFHGSDFYNRWASNRPGLDPYYTAYLAARIAGAVQEAHDTRSPARLAAGATEVWGYTRNRSLAAHVENRSVADKRTAPQRRYAAVNPWLHLVRVDTEEAGGTRPLGAWAWFSIHGTGISRHDPAYNADVWAYITGEMGRGIEARTGVRPVTAAVEGTHGDMTPAVRPGLLVYPEAERVGRGIGAAAAELHERLEGRLSASVRLACGLREIDLGTHPVVGGIRLPQPAIGAAKLAGAVENSTPLLDRIPPFRPGCPKPDRLVSGNPHGRKWIFGGRAVQERLQGSAFPRVLPVQILIVGSVSVLGLPFEITVEAGRRLESALAGVLPAAERVIVSSAANDYWDYLTTPEEYDLQCYEGASNLYGPRTLEFVTLVARELAADVAAGPDQVVDRSLESRTFAGQVRRYLAEDLPPGSGPARRVLPVADGTPGGSGSGAVTPAVGAAFVEADRWEDAYWEMRWTGGPPGSLRWDRPMLRVERMEHGSWVPVVDGGGPVDDAGWHTGVFHLGAAPGPAAGDIYAARWYQPPLGAPGSYRMVLLANHGHPELAGPAFD